MWTFKLYINIGCRRHSHCHLLTEEENDNWLNSVDFNMHQFQLSRCPSLMTFARFSIGLLIFQIVRCPFRSMINNLKKCHSKDSNLDYCCPNGTILHN